MSQPKQGCELLHQQILELRVAVASQEAGQRTRAEDTPGKSAANFLMRKVLHRLKKDCVA